MLQAQMIFFTLASPNFKIANTLSMVYSVLAMMFSGFAIEFSSLNPQLRALRYLSWTKYSYAALVYHLFKGKNVRTPRGSVDEMLDSFQLASPSTVHENVGVCVGFYLIFTLGGFLSLKHLAKEKR